MKKETEKAKCARIEAKAIGRAFSGKKDSFLKDRIELDTAVLEAGGHAGFQNRSGHIRPMVVHIRGGYRPKPHQLRQAQQGAPIDVLPCHLGLKGEDALM